MHRHRPIEARGGERPVRREAKVHGRDPSAARARPPHPDPQHVSPMAQAVACRHADAAYATARAVREVASDRLAVETRPELSLATGPDLDRQRASGKLRSLSRSDDQALVRARALGRGRQREPAPSSDEQRRNRCPPAECPSREIPAILVPVNEPTLVAPSLPDPDRRPRGVDRRPRRPGASASHTSPEFVSLHADASIGPDGGRPYPVGYRTIRPPSLAVLPPPPPRPGVCAARLPLSAAEAHEPTG